MISTNQKRGAGREGSNRALTSGGIKRIGSSEQRAAVSDFDVKAAWRSYARCLAAPKSQRLREFAPNFLVVAPPKTATTWVYQMLTQHRQVFMPEKECRYYSHFWREYPLSSYFAQFQNPFGAIRRGEASPSYFILPNVAISSLRRQIPNLKLIFILREPAARAWSHARHSYRFNEGWFYGWNEPQREISDQDWCCALLHPVARAFDDYAGPLARWLNHFPEQQLLVLSSERIATDPEQVLGEIYDFLEIEHPAAIPIQVHERANIGPSVDAPESVERVLEGLSASCIERLSRMLDLMPPRLATQLTSALSNWPARSKHRARIRNLRQLTGMRKSPIWDEFTRSSFPVSLLRWSAGSIEPPKNQELLHLAALNFEYRYFPLPVLQPATEIDRALAVARAEIAGLRRERDVLATTKSEMEQALATAHHALRQVTGERDGFATTKSEVEQALATAHHTIRRVTGERDGLAATKAEFEQTLTSAHEELGRITGERDGLAAAKEELERALTVSRADLASLTSERDGLAAANAEVEQALAIAHDELERVTGERDGFGKAKERLEQALAVARTDVAGLTSERDGLAAAKAEVEQALVTAHNELGRVTDERDGLAIANGKLEQALAVARAGIEGLTSERDGLLTTKSEVEVSVEILRDKLELVRAERDQLVAEGAVVAKTQRLAVDAIRHLPILLLMFANGKSFRARVSRLLANWGIHALRPIRRRGDKARDAHQWRKAAELYRKFLKYNPGDTAIWVQFGHALKEAAGDLDRAERAYIKALSLDPTLPDTYLQLGHAWKLKLEPDRAAAAYFCALVLDPNLRDAEDELARLDYALIGTLHHTSKNSIRSVQQIIDKPSNNSTNPTIYFPRGAELSIKT